MLIEIKGVQFVNKGAELMLHAILQRVGQEIDNASFALAVNELSPYQERAKLGMLQKFSLRAGRLDLNFISYLLPGIIKRFFLRFGIVFESDIDVVLDASGFAYGDQWPDIAVTRMVAELKRYSASNKKYIFMPQAFGPFTSDVTVSSLKDHLLKSSLIIAREDSSYKYLKDVLPETEKLQQFPDFTNLVKGIDLQVHEKLIGSVIIIPNSNMVSVRNNNSAWFESYENIMVKLGEEALGRGCELVILNHEGEADNLICTSLSARLGGVPVISEANPLAVKGIIGAAKAVISSRFHGCVSALSQGVPCLGTSWSHKYERLYEEYAVSEWLIPEKNTNEKLLMSLILDDDLLRERMNASGADLKLQSEKMWVTVFNTILNNEKAGA